MMPLRWLAKSSNGNEFLPPWRWGVFRRRECSGSLVKAAPIENVHLNNIYAGLKGIGYRETFWQYVYPGQIGGLVFNPRRGLVEHHVRFFEDGCIYAEIEFGRSAILHFLNRRMFLNRYLAAKLGRHISVEDQEYFCNAAERYKLTTMKDWPEWSMTDRFYTKGVKTQLRYFMILGDWRFLAAVMLLSFGAVSGVDIDSIFLPIMVATMIVVYLIAPKRV